jgi:pimeloyl-ACP methyl ester carboxylesterase
MPFATAGDGARLHYEETGGGTPVLFIHEFAGDLRSWEPQLRHFARLYRCIAYNARGYPPSDVPGDPGDYSQERAVDDAVAVLDHLGVERAHVVGLSMGGFCTLHLGLRRPERALSLVVAGCGYGARPEGSSDWLAESEANARGFETEFAATVEAYAAGPARVQLEDKDPRAYAEFKEHLHQHSPIGAALTLRGVQMRRPNLYDLRQDLARMTVPVLIITGDEDEPCLEPDLMLKRTIPSSALAVLPRTGHACNLEEPALFNLLVGGFLAMVDAGRWTPRNPRSVGKPPAEGSPATP